MYVAFIDFTKAFYLVSRSGLFAILRRFGCPDTLLNIILKLHDDMHATVLVIGSRSRRFPIKCGVKQGCVLCSYPLCNFLCCTAHTCLFEAVLCVIALSHLWEIGWSFPFSCQVERQTTICPRTAVWRCCLCGNCGGLEMEPRVKKWSLLDGAHRQRVTVIVATGELS